jgi:hypothetical protein
LRCGANGIVVMGKIDSGLEAAGSGLREGHNRRCGGRDAPLPLSGTAIVIGM